MAPILNAPSIVWQGTNGNDKKIGTARSEMFLGFFGNDTLNGMGGNDVLDGSHGNDVVIGGAGIDTISIMGSDRLTGGAATDIFIATGTMFNLRLPSNNSVITDFKAAGPGRDVLQLANFGVKWADRDKDMNDGFSITQKGKNALVQIEDAGGNLYKITLNNVKVGALNLQNVQLINSPIQFSAGPDAPVGEPAAVVAPTGDIIYGTEEAELLTGTRLGELVMGYEGNDTLKGLGGDDTLNGQSGADVMFGGRGADRIYVSGTDNAWGGAGADVFVFTSHAAYPEITDGGRGIIRDYSAADGVIEFLGFDVAWADRDRGLEDGMAFIQNGKDTLIRLVDADGEIMALTLKNTLVSSLTEDDFAFYF